MTKSSPRMINSMQPLGSIITRHCGRGQEKPTVSWSQLPWARVGKRTHGLAIIMILLSALALPDFSYAAGRVFYDGFEDGTTNNWTIESGRNPCPVVTSALDGGPGPRGTRMMRCNWDGGSFEGVVLNSWSYTNEFLLRFWVRLDADVDRVNGAKLFRLNWPTYDIVLQRDYSDNQFHMWWFMPGGADGMNCWNREGNFLDDHQWHKIEIYVKHDTGSNNGIVKSWRDGVFINWDCGNPRTNLNNYAGSPYYPWYVMSNWSQNPGWEHDNNNHIYWDDIEIYSDNGTGATGSMSDATINVSGAGSVNQTPPNPPQNLQVQ
jgi:hypothetical protein